MIPPRFAPIVFGFLVSGLMSFIVSLVSTLRNVGLADGVLSLWIAAWLPSWAVAFPAVLVVAPAVRRFVDRNTARANSS